MVVGENGLTFLAADVAVAFPAVDDGELLLVVVLTCGVKVGVEPAMWATDHRDTDIALQWCLVAAQLLLRAAFHDRHTLVAELATESGDGVVEGTGVSWRAVVAR